MSGFPSGVTSTPSLTRGIVSKHAPFSEFALLDGDGVVLQTDAEIESRQQRRPESSMTAALCGNATVSSKPSTPDGRDVDGIGFGIALRQ